MTNKKAFNAEILAVYPDDNGGYMHSELNAYGQIIAVSEINENLIVGSTMQFCFQLGNDGQDDVKRAYEVLKEGATIKIPLGPSDYSRCMFALIDKFGVYWCLF